MAAQPPRPAKGRPAGGGRRPDPARRDAQVQKVAALLEPAVASTGIDLEDVEIRTVGRRIVVRVLVDSETGVSLDQVAAASTAVSDALDADDPFGDEPYTLEVSSPGVDRPLTLPRHWRRSTGRLVAVTTTKHEQVTGRVLAVTDAEVELEIDVKGRTSRRTLALADIAKAVVQVEFSRKGEPEPEELDGLEDDSIDEDEEA
ncbi:MAG: ribosome maturation factor RimP [Candidatus Nanopelagicales bacterium]